MGCVCVVMVWVVYVWLRYWLCMYGLVMGCVFLVINGLCMYDYGIGYVCVAMLWGGNLF